MVRLRGCLDKQAPLFSSGLFFEKTCASKKWPADVTVLHAKSPLQPAGVGQEGRSKLGLISPALFNVIFLNSFSPFFLSSFLHFFVVPFFSSLLSFSHLLYFLLCLLFLVLQSFFFLFFSVSPFSSFPLSLLFFQDPEKPEVLEFHSLVGKIRDVPFGLSTSPEVLSHYNITINTVSIFRRVCQPCVSISLLLALLNALK